MADVYADMLAMVRRLQRPRRVVICRPELAERARAAVEDAGHADHVRVVASEHVDPGRMFIGLDPEAADHGR